MTSSPSLLVDHATLFQTLPSAYIVFGVDDPTFTILEENEAHAKVAMVKRDAVIGKPLFDVFPDTSEEYTTTGVSQLLESIRRVIATGAPDAMPHLSYDLKDPSGKLTTKYWSVVHHPVFDEAGKVTAVYQATEDITESIVTKQELDRTQYQLDQALSNASIGTWNWNLKVNKVYGDKNLAAIFDIPAEDVLKGLSLETFIRSIHPDDRQRITREIEKVISSHAPYEGEYRTINARGTVRWVIARGKLELGTDGEPVSFPGVVIDITERKQAQIELDEVENSLRFMADSMPQLVWITRPDGYHEYYNHRWYEYTGTNDGETDGEGWKNLFHPDDQARANKVWQKSLKTGQPYEIEYRLYNAATDSYRWVIGRAMPFKDEQGRIIRWYGTCTDIDEQRRSLAVQAFLAQASKELASSLDYTSTLKRVTQLCVPDVADWCSVDLYDDTTKKFEQVSLAHADPDKISLAREYRRRNPVDIGQTTGVPEVVRTKKTEFFPHIDPSTLEAYIQDKDNLKFMKSLNLHSIIIVPIVRQDKAIGAISFVSSDSGRYYTESDVQMAEEMAARISLAITNTSLYDESVAEIKERKKLEKALKKEKDMLESRVKERTELLSVTNIGLRDEITKRHAVEEELKRYSENLARSNQELQDFAYVASHDLQEPLRKIQAFGNLIQSEYGDELGDGIDYLNRMRSAASRMSILIEDLLSFSRVTTKANPSAKVDLNEVVRDVVTDLESRIEDTNGKVVVEKLPDVMADPTHMRQLFQNLIGNALKFHRPDVGAVVKVSAESVKPGDTMHTIYVKDNGIGFEEKYLDRIFSVFQRLHGKDSYEGTGIGLAVCRKIAERYGGTITARSTKGEGSTFIVNIPIAGKE